MSIRVCTEADLVVLRAAWPTAGDVHGAHYRRQRDGATYLVSWRGDEPVGSLMIQWRGPAGANAQAAFPGCVELKHLQVRPQVRGQGVGTGLLDHAEQLVSERGHPGRGERGG